MMKEKKETKIAANVSSGAEKVERVEKTVAAENQTPSTVKTTKKQTVTKKTTAKTAADKTKKEKQAANARVEAAIKKKELKAKRAAEKKAKAEKRAADKKARLEKRAAERKALLEKRKAEREAKIRERAHAKANRSQKRSKQKQNRTAKRQERRENGGGKKGYGGWLAAVIALGAVTLGLTTAVTVGAIDMKNTKDGMMSGYRGTTYELAGIMEHVDDDLDRVRVSNSPVQQQRILTDLLVQARLAELDLEKMPIPMEADRNLTSFINRVGAECERLLSKLRHGETLSEKDMAALEELYETNHSVRAQLDEYVANMQDSDIMRFIKKGEGVFKDMLDSLENLTLPENRITSNDKMKGAGMERKENDEKNDKQNDGGKDVKNGAPEALPQGGKAEGGSPKIDAKTAEELCLRYFSDYDVSQFQCVGETVARGYTAYNVQGYDGKGTLLFAEIDYQNGDLIGFNYYEPCEGEAFDMENVKMLAENFLEKLGYQDMIAVRVRENGTDVDFTYAYKQEGVVYYPDAVKVKVCRARGVVTGMDASQFLKNHQVRTEPKTAITMAQAQEKLRNGVEVQSSTLAVVKAARGERAAYEFLCTYKGEKYFIYTDAVTGEEIAIVNVKNVG